jgi:HPr kinase/phosphorylase
LVADDVVLIRRRGQALFGICSQIIRHHLEVRGLGIINVPDLFGAASVCPHKRLDLVVEIADWSDCTDYERLGLDNKFMNFLGLSVHKIHLPVRPGRNVANIVEVAARRQLLKLQGHDSLRKFEKQLQAMLGEPV